MNLGRSIKIACALKDTTQIRTAKKAGITPEYLSAVVKKNSLSSKLLVNLAASFDMPVSEFIALGEG